MSADAAAEHLRQFAVKKQQDADEEDARADDLVFAQRFFEDGNPGEEQDEWRQLRQHLRGGGGKIQKRAAEQPKVADQPQDADEDEPAVAFLQKGVRMRQAVFGAQEQAKDERGGGEAAGDDGARRDDGQDLLQDERQRRPHKDGDEGKQRSF